MKRCKTCKGKGWIFVKTIVFTGKNLPFFNLPEMVEGMEKVQCSRCFGRGLKQ